MADCRNPVAHRFTALIWRSLAAAVAMLAEDSKQWGEVARRINRGLD